MCFRDWPSMVLPSLSYACCVLCLSQTHVGTMFKVYTGGFDSMTFMPALLLCCPGPVTPAPSFMTLEWPSRLESPCRLIYWKLFYRPETRVYGRPCLGLQVHLGHTGNRVRLAFFTPGMPNPFCTKMKIIFILGPSPFDSLWTSLSYPKPGKAGTAWRVRLKA